MLELAVILEFFLERYLEGFIILVLLLFNAILGFFEETQAQKTLAALQSKLAVNASVFRDHNWSIVSASILVPGDIVRITMGSVVPADIVLLEGQLLLDVSLLTGESVPKEVGTGESGYSGSLVRRGEALAKVMSTGVHTRFGKTIQLVKTAYVESSEQKAILQVVRNLTFVNGAIFFFVMGADHSIPVTEVLPLLLTILLASIPVALPATFTLAASFGARLLAGKGALLTRLSSLEEAATMDILCADKTGTLTKNELKLIAVVPFGKASGDDVLKMAAMASNDGGQDPVDLAICNEAARLNIHMDRSRLTQFVPFDPQTKTAKAIWTDESGEVISIEKGAVRAILNECAFSEDALIKAEKWQSEGFRVLAVSMEKLGLSSVEGLVVLTDPARDDSSKLIQELSLLGIRTVLVTGDAPKTALHLAREVGISGELYPRQTISENDSPGSYGVFAGVLPEDKFNLVKVFQKAGHIVGMCGDGANDAPALSQSQMGISVLTATDVAKSAAGIVLTRPGLEGIVETVLEGRRIFQRIQTYTLNSIVKKVVTVLFLAIGLLVTHHAVLTPLLMVIILLTGDFLTMSLSTDNVEGSKRPNVWNVQGLTITGGILSFIFLTFSTTILFLGVKAFHLSLGSIRSLAFLTLVIGNQATIYAIRERGPSGNSLPGRWLILSSVVDVLIALVLAHFGVLMKPLSNQIVFVVFLGAFLYMIILYRLKIVIFNRFLMQ
jgi:H+-transporting ATPase